MNQLYQHLEPQNPVINEGPNRIDSVQNGLLLYADLHIFWDAWLLSINPVSLLESISLIGK